MNIANLHNQVTYTLQHESTNPVAIEEPIGFKEDLLEIKKSDKNFSTVTLYATNLQFILRGKNYINNIYDTYGYEAKIRLTKKSIHPTDMDLVTNYQTYLDGYTYDSKDNKVTVSTLESELNGILKNYGSEKLELENEESINGTDIGALLKHKTWVEGRDLFLLGKWRPYGDERDLILTPEFQDGFFSWEKDIRYHTLAIPLDQYVYGGSQTGDVTSFDVPTNKEEGDFLDGFPPNCFLSIVDDDSVFKLEINVDLDMFNNGGDMKSMTCELVLITYEDASLSGGHTHKYKEHETLYIGTGDKYNRNIIFYDIRDRELKKGESMCLGVKIYTHQKQGHSNYEVEMTSNVATLLWSTNSHVEGSHSDIILPFELFNRLLQLMTGRTDTIVKSDHLGRTDLGYSVDGEGSLLGVASGFYARGFQDKNLAISWNDAILSYGVADTLSYSIEKQGLQEYVRIEPLDYFFGKDIIKLTNPVKDVQIKVATKFSYSGIEIGYEDGGADYEEADGLSEFNGQHIYSTPLSRASSKYQRLSKIRGDMTGFEFARRKPESDFPSTDTSYDQDIFFLDLKRTETDILAQRFFEDDYTTLEGVYSPETATNLRISPKELLTKKHGWFVKNCLTKNLKENIYFSSGIGLLSVIVDGVKASDNVAILDLERQKFVNKEVSFTMEVDYVNQKLIENNLYQQMEVVDTKGGTYKFYIFTFKKNKFTGFLIE